MDLNGYILVDEFVDVKCLTLVSYATCIVLIIILIVGLLIHLVDGFYVIIMRICFHLLY